jgi:cation transport ATPase
MSEKVGVESKHVTFRDDRIFGFGQVDKARLFIRRSMAHPEVLSVKIDPAAGSAVVTFEVVPASRMGFLQAFSQSLGSDQNAFSDASIPVWSHDQTVTLVREAGQIVLEAASGEHALVVRAAKVPFTAANTALSLSAIGQFLVPAATPFAAGLLVATNLRAIRDAGSQLSHGKIGVPIFQTALLTCSIVTGQVLAFALTEWSIRYWQKRSRDQLAREARSLIEETLIASDSVALVDAEGTVTSSGLASIVAGSHIRLSQGDRVPFDGVVLGGEALLDETMISGARGPVRKTRDKSVLAGSTLLVGSLDVRVSDSLSSVKIDQIRHAMVDVAHAFSADQILQNKAIQMADKTVKPTLATAGVGWLAGNLITVGAILHQDWISGPELAIPLVTMHQIRQALQRGSLVRDPSAIERLSNSDFIVLDGDDPLLHCPVIELSGVESRLPDTDSVLRHVAGAGLYLGDGRSHALADACREKGLIVRQPELISLESGLVEVQLGEHKVRLLDEVTSTAEVPSSIKVEIDGQEIAILRFRQGIKAQATETVSRLKKLGYQTFLVTTESDSRAATMARTLGVDLSGGELDIDGRKRFLQGLSQRGVRPVYIGRLDTAHGIASAAALTITAGGFSTGLPLGDVVLLGDSYAALADFAEQVSTYESEIRRSTRMATLPNMLCIAGAFGGVLNGITSGIIANMGVLRVDRSLNRFSSASSKNKATPETIKLL